MTHDQQVQAALYAHQAETLDRWTAVTYGKSRTGIGFALHRAIEVFTPRRPAPAVWSMKADGSGDVEHATVPTSFFRSFDDHVNLRPLPSRTPSCGTPVSPQPSERVKSALTGATA